MRSLLDLDLPAEALTHQQQALQVKDGNARTLALHIALTATAHARAGHAEHAAQLALHALHQAQNIRSRRVTARITQLAAALEPHHRVAEVAQFLGQSRSSDAIT